MSTSDDQLDALYKKLEDAGQDSTSPADLDAQLRAAARESVQTDGTEVAGRGWQRRYGWATAASLLLASGLFLSLPETAPQRSKALEKLATQRQSPQLNSPAAEFDAVAVPELTTSPAAEAKQSVDSLSGSLSGSAADSSAVASALTSEEADQLRLEQRHSGRTRQAFEPTPQPPSVDAPPPVVSDVAAVQDNAGRADDSTSPFASQISTKKSSDIEAAQAIATQNRSLAAARKSQVPQPEISDVAADAPPQEPGGILEEVIVTGSRQQSRCEQYNKLIIAKVCRQSDTDYSLYANPASRCVGQVLVVHTTDGMPLPHDTSDKRRFVIESPDGELQAVTCKVGKLQLQSLARGR